MPHSTSWLPGQVLSVTQVGVSPVPMPSRLGCPPQCGNRRPFCPRLHQTWHLWRLGEHLPYLQGRSSTFRSFANLRALSWARLPFTLLPQMFNFRCCFQNLFLLLLGHWPETSLLTAATSHFQPPCHCSLLGKPESRKETDLCGGQLRVWETESVARLCWWKQKGAKPCLQKPRQSFLVFGRWSPGFWCCSSWCQSLDLSTSQQNQHLPLPQMLYGRGTAVVPSCWGYLKI
ncbi:hypothetical protein mRhiFer1_010237 [Rhinolophus ferrumequinum]|uniref:Uncharacterized protein n=1 Tax=Rhinolophus ferrumequinum TaxID=59479 RepID=A0A7J7X5A7_RHIFE|nr:hypothetical protein mRhiFer1_010237 [Rhinolophus ferrumequinum]